MTESRQRRFFFVHLMKTGGATFRQHLYANFAEGSVYPHQSHEWFERQRAHDPTFASGPPTYSGEADDMDRSWLVAELLGLPAQRHATIEVYTGHFPYVVTEMLGGPITTLTILRDPVERTISYLKHCKRYHEQHRDLTLEQIYDDDFYFRCFVHNHQAKLFAMTTDDRLESYMDEVDVDDARLEIAKANLEKIHVIGLTERHDELLEELTHRFGWRFAPLSKQRVSREPWEVSSSLRDRITNDNAQDVRFYDHATQLYEQRRRARVGA